MNVVHMKSSLYKTWFFHTNHKFPKRVLPILYNLSYNRLLDNKDDNSEYRFPNNKNHNLPTIDKYSCKIPICIDRYFDKASIDWTIQDF